VTGIELVVGYLAAWAVRKLKRVGQAADAEVDRALDAALEKVHDVVTAKLAGDPALAKLEASPAQVTELTSRRVADAITAATQDDQDFAEQLSAAIQAARVAVTAAGGLGVAFATDGGIAAGRDVIMTATHGGVVSGKIDSVNVGVPPTSPKTGSDAESQDPARPGRPTG
jgi:hypothetical protein